MSAAKYYKWLSELNTSANTPFEYKTDIKKVWCKSCEKAINADQKGQFVA